MRKLVEKCRRDERAAESLSLCRQMALDDNGKLQLKIMAELC